MRIAIVSASLCLLVGGGRAQVDVTKDLGASDFIRWTLQGSGWQTGQFANGDWWVVVPFGQTLTVTATTFSAGATPYEFTPGAVSVGGTSQPRVRSGSIKNPRSIEGVTFPNIYFGAPNTGDPFSTAPTFTGSQPTGYDSRSGWFHPAFVTPLPVTLQAWDVLVTTISQPNATNRPDYDPPSWTVRGTGWLTNFDPAQGSDATSTTQLASVLTVLPEVPPGTTSGESPCLRPPYGGTPASRALWSGGATSGVQPASYLTPWSWNASTLLSRTPSVVRPAGIGCPNASAVLGFWRGTFLDHLQHENCGTFLAPSSATPTYGRDQMAMLGTTALMLCEEASPQMSLGQKESLLAPFLQFGIDCFGMSKDGRRFNGSGGHSGGRKWSVLYAGILMDNLDMREEAGPFQSAPDHRWKEDAQCLTRNAPSGAPIADWQGLLYRWRSADSVVTVYQDTPPSASGNNWSYPQCRDENYRVCCTLPAYVYFDLVCRLLENHPPAAAIGRAMEAWGNDAFFGCVDRYMLPMTPEACADYDYMEVIRAAVNGDETITGHYSGWGRSVGILYQSRYGQEMWRSFRWQNHQRGVSIAGPAGFSGAQHYCQYGPALDELRCQTPAESAVNPAPRSLPTLITEQSAANGSTVWFEVHGVPPDSVLSVYVAGNQANLGLLNPSMNCACTSSATSLCGAPLFVDYPNAALLSLVSTNYSYRNLNFSLTLPSVIGSFAIQAVMMPLDLSNYVSTNAYSIATY